MRIAQGRLEVATAGRGFYELTSQAAAWVAEQGVGTGLLTLFIRHTSPSLLIQENAAPEVRADLADFLSGLAPEDSSRWRHDDGGADDMPAHARAAMLPVQLSVPVARRPAAPWNPAGDLRGRTSAASASARDHPPFGRNLTHFCA